MEHYTISDLASEFDVSTRTIRYYEERGLIFPDRKDSGQRLYSRKDRARLRLILRGKRFGFSLAEIEEMIELFDEDRTGVKQLEKTIEYGSEKIAEITTRLEDMEQLRTEMLSLQDDFKRRLELAKKEEE
ncbi:MerR family transcriptional regulator [Bacillus sp. FJAT-45350]|uniref:MerR family transcriptional regulator n=1 Tax=Bacillus sp. FJAT-45350 TaxID=2011014 RepID=UPI000BB6EF65|nr:MerR family DNA-binding transcriptional regulator [Bacillus sp. FJAT-45350]